MMKTEQPYLEQEHADWVAKAKELFRVPRPEHFTDFKHCCECYDHDQTLLASDIDSIGLEELGNPGWDPICFATPEARKYYLPAFVRLSLDTMADEFYLAQFVFHLQWGGSDNTFYLNCDASQRKFVAAFLEHLIERYPDEIENSYCADDVLAAFQIWSES